MDRLEFTGLVLEKIAANKSEAPPGPSLYSKARSRARKAGRGAYDIGGAIFTGRKPKTVRQAEKIRGRAKGNIEELYKSQRARPKGRKKWSIDEREHAKAMRRRLGQASDIERRSLSGKAYRHRKPIRAGLIGAGAGITIKKLRDYLKKKKQER